MDIVIGEWLRNFILHMAGDTREQGGVVSKNMTVTIVASRNSERKLWSQCRLAWGDLQRCKRAAQPGVDGPQERWAEGLPTLPRGLVFSPASLDCVA